MKLILERIANRANYCIGKLYRANEGPLPEGERRLLKKSTGTHNLSFLRVFMLLIICLSQYFFVSLLSQIMIVKCLKANKNCN